MGGVVALGWTLEFHSESLRHQNLSSVSPLCTRSHQQIDELALIMIEWLIHRHAVAGIGDWYALYREGAP